MVQYISRTDLGWLDYVYAFLGLGVECTMAQIECSVAD